MRFRPKGAAPWSSGSSVSRGVVNETSEVAIGPNQRSREFSRFARVIRGGAKINGVMAAALDDFRNWLDWACGPRKTMKIVARSEWRWERRHRSEPLEPSRPSNCLIRNVRD